MTEIVRAGSRDRARSTQIGIACELRWKPGAAVLELTMDGGPRIRAGLGDPGFSDLHHPAFCNPLPAARDGPLTDGEAACEYTIRFVRVPELTTEPARQRDEPPGNPMVRYRSSSSQANITFDADRFVTPARTISNTSDEAAQPIGPLGQPTSRWFPLITPRCAWPCRASPSCLCPVESWGRRTLCPAAGSLPDCGPRACRPDQSRSRVP